ncbi:hypothetical protein L873DRAFT_1815336, partial [Choiromyces venosus 120613-1]
MPALLAIISHLFDLTWAANRKEGVSSLKELRGCWFGTMVCWNIEEKRSTDSGSQKCLIDSLLGFTGFFIPSKHM